MFTEEMRLSLEKYLAENYVETSEQYTDYALNVDIVKESGKCFSRKETFSLEELVNEVGESFHEMLFLNLERLSVDMNFK